MLTVRGAQILVQEEAADKARSAAKSADKKERSLVKKLGKLEAKGDPKASKVVGEVNKARRDKAAADATLQKQEHALETRKHASFVRAATSLAQQGGDGAKASIAAFEALGELGASPCEPKVPGAPRPERSLNKAKAALGLDDGLPELGLLADKHRE